MGSACRINNSACEEATLGEYHAQHSDVILGPVPRICNVLILFTCLDPWDKPKDDAEYAKRLVIKPEGNPSNRPLPSAANLRP
ncbi:hypothetical protein YA62_002770 [Agrobacterium sp. LC34]|nr:hypothetical protein YA62_002770 [Agrobacterium sp. LC34]